MPGDLRLRFHQRQQLISDLCNLDRRNPDSLQRFNLTHPADQFAQAGVSIFPIPAGMYPGQNNFLMLLSQPPRFLQRFVQRQRAFPAAGIRDDAVSAELVASILHL